MKKDAPTKKFYVTLFADQTIVLKSCLVVEVPAIATSRRS